MGITGGPPETGLRLELERAARGGPPWTYEGFAVTKDARFAVRAVVEADGAVAIDVGAPDAPRDVAERAKLIVRAAYKHAKEGAEDAAPPRRITRWRADRPT
jgi:hypothetical protein